MFKKLLSLAAFVFSMGSAWATSDWTTGDNVSYYLYNVESGMFLKGSNNWGTRAALSSEGETFKLVASDDDVVIKCDRAGNGVFVDNANALYVDMGSQNRNFKWAITKNEDGTCYIRIAEGDGSYGKDTDYNQAYLGSLMSYVAGSANDYNVMPIGESMIQQAGITWMILTVDEYNTIKANNTIDARKAAWPIVKSANLTGLTDKTNMNVFYSSTSTPQEIENAAAALKTQIEELTASKESPVDITYKVNNPEFNSGAEGWTMTAANQNLSGGEDVNRCAESWRSSNGFVITQTLTGLKNGIYSVKCQAACNDYDNSGNIPTLNVNDAKTSFNQISNSETSLSAMSGSFSAGRYFISAEAIVLDGNLTIGASCTNTALWSIFDNFQVQYLGVDLTALKNALADKITIAQGITGKMNTTVAGTLSTRISEAQNCTETEEALNTAITNLGNAITDAQNSVAVYEQIAAMNTKVKAMDDAANTAYAETLAAYNNGTLETVAEAQTGYFNAIKAQTTEGADFTDLIINPNFNSGFSKGWTNNGMGIQNNGVLKSTSGGNFAEKYQAGSDAIVYITQTIKSLPAGQYKITAYAIARDYKNAYIAANEVKVNLETTDTQKEYSVTVMIDDNSDITIKAQATGTGTTYSWFAIDDFRMTLVSKGYPELTAVTGKMNSEIETAQTNALSAYNTEKTVANYSAAASAIADADASVKAYIAVNGYLTTANTILNSTNIYTATAREAYYGKISEYQVKYDNGTLTTDEQSTAKTTLTGPANYYKPTNVMTSYVASAWSTTNDVNIYTNDWSWEGGQDGNSGMTTPFIENWVADANKLADTEVSATMTELSNGQYKFSALVRLFNNKTGEDEGFEGIKFFANDVVAELPEGTTYPDGNLYNVEVTALVKEGTLKMGYTIENTNISWVAMKNCKYEKLRDLTEEEQMVYATAEEIQALIEAIETADGYKIGFLQGQYSPYANKDAIDVLANAKKIDTTAPVSQKTITDATSALKNATWEVNTEQVNAIFNGDFEDTYAVKEDSGVSADRAIYIPNGWTVDYTGDKNDMTVLNSDDLSYTGNFDKSAAPTPFENGGNNTYRYRGKWGTTTKIDVYQNITLPAGTYTLSCDAWKSGLGGNGTIFVDSETATLDGNATEWKPLSMTFTLAEAKTIKVGFNIIHNSDNSEKFIGFDNFDLKLADITRATAKGKYGTICLPYAFEATGATLYSAEAGEDVVTLFEVNELEAGKSYIYQATADEQTFVYKEGDIVSKPETYGSLTGVFTATAVPVGAYVMQTKGDDQKFYKVAEGSQPILSAYKAYLTVPETSAGAKSLNIANASETAIKTLDALTSGNAKIYDLNGRELKSLQKGINIVNGVKVFVK